MPPRFDAYVQYRDLLNLGEGYMKRTYCTYYYSTTILFSIQIIIKKYEWDFFLNLLCCIVLK